MIVILEGIDPLWHEELLTIQILSHGSCHRNELKKKIREAQKTKLATLPPHSTSAYNYWFRDLKNRGIITEEGKIMSLTDLGHWIAMGNVGTLPVRSQFAYLACDQCSNTTQIVLSTPLMDTLTSNSQGKPFVDLECPVCGGLSSRNNLGSIANKEQIAKFYNQTSAELEKFVKLVWIRIPE